MKEPKETTVYYFVDETGDPIFYGRKGRNLLGTEGCSPILALGFIECQKTHKIRTALNVLRANILVDPYFKEIPSIQKTSIAFHAKDDCPEIRMLVFRELAKLNFKVQVVVGRKILNMFQKRFRSSTDAFYDDLVTKLFENVLHRNARNLICFSSRSSKKRQKPLLNAIRRGG